MTSAAKLRMRALIGGGLAALMLSACGTPGLPVAQTVITTTTSTTVPASTTTSTSTSTLPGITTSIAQEASPTTEPVTSAPRLTWAGGERFALGANLPWFNWGCDFGCGQGARDGQGVSAQAVQDALGPVLGRASESGMDIVRWWMFPDEPWQIEADAGGLPVRISDTVYEDLDAALLLADEHDVYFVFNLFSAPSALPTAWLTTPEGRTRLAEVLGEMFARYRDNPRILTWQVVNEPEWEIRNGVVEHRDVLDLVTVVAASIAWNSDALSSIGSANLEGIELWTDAGLDYYTAHWYDAMDSGLACALCTDYAELATEFGLDRPLVIGEFYGGPDVGLEARLDSFVARGYAGAWAWSLMPDRTSDQMEIDFAAAAAFAERQAEP